MTCPSAAKYSGENNRSFSAPRGACPTTISSAHAAYAATYPQTTPGARVSRRAGEAEESRGRGVEE